MEARAKNRKAATLHVVRRAALEPELRAIGAIVVRDRIRGDAEMGLQPLSDFLDSLLHFRPVGGARRRCNDAVRFRERAQRLPRGAGLAVSTVRKAHLIEI